jgi:hypothetical protein
MIQCKHELVPEELQRLRATDVAEQYIFMKLLRTFQVTLCWKISQPIPS